MTGSFRLRIGIISVVIGGHFGGGDHFDGGDHFGGGTGFLSSKPRPRLEIVNLLPPVRWDFLSCYVLFGLFVSNNLSGVPVN